MKRVPWRLVFGLVVLVCATIFASLNLQRVNVSVGFHVFQDVPLFLALIFAYIAGALCVLPFALVSKKPRRAKGGPAGPAAQQVGEGAPHA